MVGRWRTIWRLDGDRRLCASYVLVLSSVEGVMREINSDGNNDTAAAKSTKRAAPKRMHRKTRTQSAPDAPSPDAPVLIAPAAASSPDTAAFASATDFDAPALSVTSPTEFDPSALSYSEDWDTSHYGPQDFDMVLDDIMSDSASASSFSLGTTENTWSDGESLSMAEEFAPIAAAHPAPWAINSTCRGIAMCTGPARCPR
ncbi:hypothetical protein B0H13DRAFT_2393391 [Mycena leptocephala]|nr:hypothetical protein B0H13DRAFT_2393391 [Mycena leptocephala]